MSDRRPATEIRDEILRLVREYASAKHGGFTLPVEGDDRGFVPGETTVP